MRGAVDAPGTEQSTLLKKLVASVAHNTALRKIALSTPGVRNVAWRFVAGEDLASGLAAAHALGAAGIRATLSCVGTHVRSAEEAEAAAEAAIGAPRRMRAEGLEPNVSVKPTQVGLDIDEALCRSSLHRIVACAAEVEGFVRVDMEESPYVDATVRLFGEARRAWGDRIGIVLQSYLRGRSAAVERAIAERWRVRLVKGGYWEGPHVVLRDKAEIDDAFRRDAEALLTRGGHLALATHDDEAIAHVGRVADRAGIPRAGYEIQMLYGVRPDLQQELARQGHVVRCYVPFGSRWYEYVLGCVRRLPSAALDSARRQLRLRRR